MLRGFGFGRSRVLRFGSTEADRGSLGLSGYKSSIGVYKA